MTSYPSSSRARLASLVLVLTLVPEAMAIQPHAPAGVAASALAQMGEPPRVSPAVDADESKQWAASDPAFRAFVAEAGVPWSARWDRRTGHLSFASGSFPAWLPADHRARTPQEIASTRALLEQRARDLMARHPDLLGIPPSARLILDERRSVPVDDGRLWQIDFRVELGGVPVTDAHVSFRLNSGRLVQLGQAGLADVLEIMDVTPRVDASTIAARAEADLAALLGPSHADVEITDAPHLELLPTSPDPWHFYGAAGTGLQYRLAWRMTLREPSAIETWVVLHDAVTGERLFVFDSNRYLCPAPPVAQGRVVGGITAGPLETTPETVHGFPYAEVVNGAVVDADVNGVFPFTVGSPASTTLSGQYFDLDCATCDTPAQAYAQSQSSGPLHMGLGGNNDSGNGLSTRAERNCFFHLNVIRQIASKHLSDAAVSGFFTRRMPATVNIDDQCNAFYGGGAVNFFHAQGGCNNTGEIADVMQHEWGHGLDDATAGGIQDGGMSEGMADVTAFHATHDSRMAAFFVVGDANGLRNADENVAGVRTWGQVDALCPGREVHCVGEIYTQPWWHLASLLRQRAVVAGGTEAAGWFLSEHLFFQHLPFADTMDPAAANNMYDAVTLVDDDDGNLGDGIPDGVEINSAFSHHGFVSAPAVADSANCTPPAAPSVALTAAQDPATSSWQITIDWTAVPGAVEYRVFRNETGGASGEVQVATVLAPGLGFRDDDVANGVTYYYRVMAFLANGCFSIGETVQSTVIPDRLAFVLDALAIDDAVAGNMNGTADPGEMLTLRITARNASSLDATSVVATLTSSDPGVAIVQGTQALGDMASGAAASTSAPHFVIRLGRALVSCPDTVPLEISFDAPQGCTAVATGISVGPSPQTDDFETNRGWRVDPDGTDTATGGIWVRAVPFSVGAQVAEDHSPSPGTQCFVTGNGVDFFNPSDDFDDVEGGCTSLESPVYDLGGRSGLTLSYWRAFEIQAPADDDLVVEIRNGPCGTWTELERLAAPTGGWAQASFPLDAVLGGPAKWIQLRFTACDTGAPSIIEAAVDDIAFSGFSCEGPEMRPRLTVTGLAIGDSAVSGGNGNGNGALDPGERVRLPLDVRNDGNAQATAVAATLTITSGSASVTDASASWPDVAIGQAQTTLAAPGDVEIAIAPAAACGSTVCGAVDVTYSGPSGSYTMHHDFSLLVGRVVETEAYFDDFEGAGDNGVTHGEGVFRNVGCIQNPPCDDWRHGTCAPSQWDPPDTLVPGGRVWGNDLAQGFPPNDDGVYENDCCSNLEFPPIDCSGLTNVRLSFLRWLTAAGERVAGPNPVPGDQARVLIRRQFDPGFSTVWEKPQAADRIDTEWTPVEYDVSAIAAGDPGVVIRFELETDGRRQRGGWTIDDLRVFDRSTICNAFDPCGVPALPLATGPVLRATGRKDDNGAEYSWTAAVRAPLDEFRLYRGTIASDVSTLVTPPGHVALTWDDRAAPGPLYFYRLVLANCLGQEGPADP
jgi:hypothetical protein